MLERLRKRIFKPAPGSLSKEQLGLIDDDELKKRVDNRPGPAVNEDMIWERISDVKFMQLPNSTVIVCNITFDNGWSVRGEAACVAAENFDQDVSQRIAFEKAFEECWRLFGFLLSETLQEYRPLAPVYTIGEIALIAYNGSRPLTPATMLPLVEDMDSEMMQTVENMVLFHLDHPDATPQLAHAQWISEMTSNGWKHGKKLHIGNQTHPLIAPFPDLPPEYQASAYVFRNIVHALMPFISAPTIYVPDTSEEKGAA